MRFLEEDVKGKSLRFFWKGMILEYRLYEEEEEEEKEGEAEKRREEERYIFNFRVGLLVGVLYKFYVLYIN